ncbi:hypothetical protein [Bradyrhizobium sp. SZCCHNS3002]|uniref:hypothetical protein n=1 Tax=Bradyrhizobium sp. SZCCHNS3002 TaxID=3057310 RepID=UPI0028ED6F1C|nr:hypothetical protein [Bradyrhizobium sp. SZCCHNS3002]
MDLSTWRALMSGERPAPDWLAADNGFASVCGMREAHAPIAAAVRTVTAGARYNIIDLGCGNGALLAASCEGTPDLQPLGIERDSRKLVHARAMFGRAVSHWPSCDMFACPAPLETAADRSVVLIMPGRLLEAGADRAAALCRWLRSHADIILCYAYPDWIARYGNLDELGRRAGFASLESVGPDRTIAIGRLP